MKNFLLDFFFKITAINPTPAASTEFLKQVLVVVKPKSGATEDTITLATSMSTVATFTDNVEAQQLFNAGMSRVYVLAVDDLDMASILEGHESDFYTILVSSDFNDTEFDAITVGEFEGVVAFASTDDTKNLARVAAGYAPFHSDATHKAKNMFFAYGKLLSNSLNWRNQQYILMPFASDVDDLGKANSLFDDKISFVLSDATYGNRLALLSVGGEAITAPYVVKNLMIDLQSRGLSYISGNQPDYTLVQAALLEDDLQDVMKTYIEKKKWIENGTVEVQLLEENFTGAVDINIAKPRAFWRLAGEMRQTL